MVSDELNDNGSNPEKKALSPPTEIQTAMMQELTPLSIQATTTSAAKEVTIAQVAPLVLVLTGATFLSVRPSLLSPFHHTNNRTTRADHLSTICRHNLAANKPRPEDP